MHTEEALISVSVPANGGQETFEVQPGHPIFILGSNGTGKSALVHRLNSELRNEQIIYIPGSRPSYFDNESLSLTPASRRDLRRNMMAWDFSPDTRWKSIAGTSRNEKAIHDLQAAESQYKIDAANQIETEGGNSEAIVRLQSKNSPLDRVNSLLAQGNLPIQMLMHQGELRAQQSGHIYSYAKMSDGERAALVFAAEVVSAPTGTVFLIDEPELHLHPAIVVPLLKALIAEKPNCGFIISTHELDLPGSVENSSILLVRGSTWIDGTIQQWSLDVLGDAEEIPEWVRRDIIGSREKILFIEGTSCSLDQPLYSLLFPAVSVQSRENCREVMRAVEGLRSVEPKHRVQAFGLVDHDGMGAERKAELEASGIYPLPIYAVESLYYSRELLTAIAERQSAFLGMPAQAMLAEAMSAAVTALKQNGTASHLASRIAERKMRDSLMLSLPSRDAMVQGKGDINVIIPSPYPDELALITQMIAMQDVDAVVARYPVRESGVLQALAKGLHFSSRTDYERAALTLTATDEGLRETLRARLGSLTEALTTELQIGDVNAI